MESLTFKVDGVFYFSGICDVFFSDLTVACFSSPFKVIIIQTPFYYFQKPAFLGLSDNCTNIYKCELAVEQLKKKIEKML